ncbi:ATP-binding protein [Sodaliphilus sp.]|uniref:ATP-binding protein n=1 Tax=Sodaliphilus sp. TaxID=2815818 RepID=UPI00388E36E4
MRTKYFRNPIRYVGMQRIEDLEIPEEALREIIYNAIIHKQYSGVPIQMRVYNDHIELWNNGELPDTLTAEKLMQKHSSYPRNLSIAGVFLAAGFIESWGRGIEKICSGFKNAKINNPIFEAIQGGVRVTFERNSAIKGQSDPINDPINDPKVAHAELTDRQLNILNIIEQNPNVSRKELTQKLLVSDATIKRDLQVMQKKGIISRIGGRKTGQWVIIK